jgi:Cu-Zn family superoxide dismutase
MSHSEQGRRWGRRKSALVTAVVSLAVWAAAAPGQPSWAEAPGPQCALYQEGTGDNGTVSYEIAGAQPEGVGFDARDCSFYTAGSFVRGEVYRGRLDQPKAELFLPPEADRHSAFGIEVDTKRDLLLVVGGQIGVLYAYDLSEKKLHGRFDTGPGGFLNEVTVAPNGDVYVTDSSRPTLYRIKAADVAAGSGSPESIPLGPEVAYGPGVNANGVVVTPDGQHVIFALTNSGKLYRLTPGAGGGARQIKEIAIDRGPLTSADGLEIDGHTIFAVRNRDDVLVALTMSEDYSSAKVTGERTDPLFKTPTSVSLAPDGRLVVANAEYFNSDGAPYYVLSVKRP